MFEFLGKKSVENKLPCEQVLAVSEQAIISLIFASFMAGVVVALTCAWLGFEVYSNLEKVEQQS